MPGTAITARGRALFEAGFQPADLVGFSGRGRDSYGIRVATCSRFSHIGGVAFVRQAQLASLVYHGGLDLPPAVVDEWRDAYALFESTTLNDQPCIFRRQKIDGTQAHDPRKRIESYDGRVWLFRLKDDWKLSPHRQRQLSGFLLNKLGVRYDGTQAILAGSRILRKHWWFSQSDMSALFCSEYWDQALQHVGLRNIGNASTTSPARLLRELVHAGVYQRGVLIRK